MKPNFEVWLRRADGWSIVNSETGADHFMDLKRAQKVLNAKMSTDVIEGAVIERRAVVVVRGSAPDVPAPKEPSNA